jgi:uncharacterized protein (DUF342 family)
VGAYTRLRCRNLSEGVARGCAQLGILPQQAELKVVDRDDSSVARRFTVVVTATESATIAPAIILATAPKIQLAAAPAPLPPARAPIPAHAPMPAPKTVVPAVDVPPAPEGPDAGELAPALRDEEGSGKEAQVGGPDDPGDPKDREDDGKDGEPQVGFVVSISADGLEAIVRTVAMGPQAKGAFAEVREALAAAGVVSGLNESAIEELAAGVGPGQQWVVARGRLALPGQDGRLVFTFNVGEGHTGAAGQAGSTGPVDQQGAAGQVGSAGSAAQGAPPDTTGDGRVDHRAAAFSRAVAKGEVLAALIPAGPGVEGMSVRGAVIPPTAGKPAKLLAGPNVEVSEDGLRFAAAASGFPMLKNGRLAVQTVLRIDGDVDFSVGNIDCPGSVVVQGNVRPGFTVKAGGDLEIRGLVEGAFLEAAGTVRVAQGMKGAGKGTAQAGKDLVARFLESVRVRAGGTITAEAILSSHVSAAGKVSCIDGRGSIAGGYVAAGEEIVARVLGSPLEIPTELAVGIDPGVREGLYNTVEELRSTGTDLERVEHALTFFRQYAKTHTLSPLQRETGQKLTRQRLTLLRRRQELEVAKVSLEDQASRMKQGRVIAREAMHSGVKITIGYGIWDNQEDRSAGTAVLGADGEVEWKSARPR